MNKQSLTKKLKRFWPLYAMMAPGFIYIFINNYLPMPGIILAFKKYNSRDGIYGSPFAGFKNFEFLFKTGDAWIITRNTVLYNLVFIVLGTVAAIAVAIVLNEIRSKTTRKIYQVCILVPYLVSMVIVSYLVSALLSDANGFVNKQILENLGQSGISWYSEPKYWPVILTLVSIWKGVGYNSIMYFAMIVAIDRTYYEAAKVDGASKWQQLVHITLPGIKSTIVILTLMNVGRIFYSDFGLFYQVPMNSGPLINVTNTIDTYVYRGLMESSNLGMTAAAGLYQSLVGFVLVVAANYVVNKINSDSALF